MNGAPRIAPELAMTATLAAIAATGYVLAQTGVLAVMHPAPGLHGTAREAAAIAARNTAVAALFIVIAHAPLARRRFPMLTIDALGLAILLPVTLLVGQFLAAAGGWRYFVHAPLELAALSAAYGWWWRHHETQPDRSRTARRLALVAVALTIAALLETFLTPNR